MSPGPSPWRRISPLGLIVVATLLLMQTSQVDAQGVLCDAEYEWACASGDTCIPLSYVCDSEADCEDESDENTAVCATWQCTEDQFECETARETGQTPLCTSIFYVCDSENDCADGSDEKNETECNAFFMQFFGFTTTSAPTCPSTLISCDYDGICIPGDLKCDTKHDCTRGEDEKDCDYADCDDATQFTCHSNQCIEKTKVCDGTADCKDASDEYNGLCNTPAPVCRESEFQCLNGKCVNLNTDICNGVDNCGDNSDEEICSFLGVNECANQTLSGCSDTCVDQTFGFKCTCPEGHRLKSDRKTCEDIDECAEGTSPCSQVCTNTPGSFLCSCVQGYMLANNSDSICHSTSSVEPFLVFGNKYYIQKMDLEGKNSLPVSQGHIYTHVLDYDYQSQVYYFADAPERKQTLMRMNFNGTEMEEIHTTQALGVEGIAVDWVTKKIYWTSNRQRGIYVSETDGSSLKVLIHDKSPLPRAIVLYPQTGHMFWTDWDLEPFIAQVGMDGSDIKKIITDNIFWPNGLTIDYVQKQLWWVDAQLDVLERANFDGSQREIMMSDLPHPFALSIYEEWVYWSEWNLLGIERANRFTGGNRTSIKNNTLMPYDIHVVHPDRQVNLPNPCGNNNGGCSHLCLLKPVSNSPPTFVCACPDNYEFVNETTCVHKCSEGHFLCPAPDDECLSMRQKCDGRNDCLDGSDEKDCPEANCVPGYFDCVDSVECVPYWRLCDGATQCSDGSDEDPQMCSATECLSYEFRCNSGQCIPLAWVCDSDDDCSDASDEQPLNDKCRECDEPDVFKCDNGECIPRLWVCDWDNDCGDMSDEPRQECYKNFTGCLPGWKPCKTNYRCVPEVNFCDGNDDCRDNSDEDPENCPKCPKGDFACLSGTPACIPERWKCDFRDDCEDKSDENTTLCSDKYRQCEPDVELTCSNQKCVALSRRCDGVNDCQDGESETDPGTDEEGCPPPTCYAFQFQCIDMSCIPSDYQCDGTIHCRDASDETSCPTRYPDGKYCSSTQFQCNNTACIPYSYVCDGDNDCRDSSDETVQVCDARRCSPDDFFRCTGSQRCIPLGLKCDGLEQCDDGSDEENCPKPECTVEQFKCLSADCVPMGSICDGTNDCPDGDDEFRCDKYGACNSTSCDQKCENITVTEQRSPVTYHRCSCDAGYRLNPETSSKCDDIDECALVANNYCTQLCRNSKGSFFCDCMEGFRFAEPDGCNSDDDDYVMYSVGHKIKEVDMRNGVDRNLVLALNSVDAIDYDPLKNIIYWIDSMSGLISRSALPKDRKDLGVPQALNVNGLGKVVDISYDWLGENLYYADSTNRKISVSKSNWGYLKTVITLDKAITSVAVNSYLGLMYWAEIGDLTNPNGRIRYGNMSGRGIPISIAMDRVWEPTSLAIDYNSNGRVYWADRRKHTVESIGSTGRDYMIVTEVRDIFKIDVFSDYILWTSTQAGRKFGKIDKFGREQKPDQYTDRLPISSFVLYNTQKKPLPEKNPCEDLKDCVGMCLLEAGGKAHCGCPNMWESDGVCEQPQTVERLTEPVACSCRNNGACVILEGRPICSCTSGFGGARCEKVIPVQSSTLTPSTTTTTTSTSGNNNQRLLVAAIVAPIVIAVVLLGLVALIAYWLKMRGNLGKVRSGHGELRQGNAWGRSSQRSSLPTRTPHDHLSAEAAAYEHGVPVTREISIEDGAVHFSNPVYAKKSDGDSKKAESLPRSEKADINTNYEYRPAENTPTIAEAVSGLAEVQLDFKEQTA